MLFFTSAIYGHCSFTDMGVNGEYKPSRKSQSNEDPIHNSGLTEAQWACRDSQKEPSQFTITPGTSAALTFNPGCNSGREEDDIAVITRGEPNTSFGGGVVGGKGKFNGRHSGGYCELSIAYNEQPTMEDFVVFNQWDKSCPDSKMEYEFDFPATLPSGEAVLQWTWISVSPAQFYSTCIDITVEGNSELPGLAGRCVHVKNAADENVYEVPGTNGELANAGLTGNPADIFPVEVTPAEVSGCTFGGDDIGSPGGQPAAPPVGQLPEATGAAAPPAEEEEQEQGEQPAEEEEQEQGEQPAEEEEQEQGEQPTEEEKEQEQGEQPAEEEEGEESAPETDEETEESQDSTDESQVYEAAEAEEATGTEEVPSDPPQQQMEEASQDKCSR